MFMFLRPTMEEIADLETAFNKTKFAEYLIPTYSYVSVVELSKYAPQKDGVDPETLPETQARLKPILPKWNHMSFYPMDRRREGMTTGTHWRKMPEGSFSMSIIKQEGSMRGR